MMQAAAIIVPKKATPADTWTRANRKWEFQLQKREALTIAPFGDNPAALDGVDFFNGTATEGMIVWKTPGTYSITPEDEADVESLVVAGGGSGGSRFEGGGGGAGGLLHGTIAIDTSALTVTVGVGGETKTSSRGDLGTNSVFGDKTANGGGGGGGYTGSTHQDPTEGGSGGGAQNRGSTANTGAISNQTAQSPLDHYGNKGGNTHNQNCGGGGGGGAGADGANVTSENGGDGGDGREYFGFWYGGGGGGAPRSTGAPGSGGNGGGGDGDASAGYDATANSGGGGGGVTGSNPSGAGGSGIVIVRWGGYSKNYNPTDDSVTEV